MYVYSAFGLNIHSYLALPELAPVEYDLQEKDADVLVRRETIAGAPEVPEGEVRGIRAEGREVYLTWPGIGRFLVRDGREILIDPEPGVEEDVLRLFVLGTSMAMLLHQRQELAVFHASAVSYFDSALVFAGNRGAGKSGLAAAFHAEGSQLLADDVVAIDLSRSSPIVLPGFPFMKMWPETLAAMGHQPEALPKLRPEVEKRGYRIANGFSKGSVPLRAFFILAWGETITIERLHGQDALFGLMSFWYATRFGSEVLQVMGLPDQFERCARLVNEVPVYLLSKPDEQEALLESTKRVKSLLRSP
jgi:hypothetical protein